MPVDADWQVKMLGVADRTAYLLRSSLWSDCAFKVGESSEQQEFLAHKLILAAASPVFEAMFYGPIAEKECVVLPDVKPDAFAVILGYIYADVVKLKSVEEACSVMYAAKKYMLPHVEKKCVEFLISNIETSNVCYVYEFGESMGESVLTAKCMEMIRSRTAFILREKYFTTISPMTLLSILKQDEMNVDSEIRLFRALEEWSFAECKREDIAPTLENRRSVVEEALGKIRFLTLNEQEFTEVEKSGLFTEEECTALKNHIKNPKLCSPPSNICKIERRRCDTFPGFSYCTRRFCKSGMTVSGHTKTKTKVTTNYTVFVSGIRVSARIPGLESFAFRTPPFTYKEDMEVIVLDTNNSVIWNTHFREQVQYNTLVSIHFHGAIVFESGKEYSIITKIKGDYSLDYLSSFESSKNVEFTFCDYVDRYQTGRFVHERVSILNGLIFAK